MSRRKFGNDEYEAEPAADDFVISACGPLGSKTCVGQVEGKFVGKFNTEREVERAICATMDREEFYPNTWFQDDHGGMTLRSVDCPRPRRRRRR